MSFAEQLQEIVTTEASRAGVPGVAVGVVYDGQEHVAVHGVTSIEHPLPVDEHTLFQFGSTGKTYTATAIMRLVERGQVDLDAPVRRYLPEFRVADPDASERATVLNLLNHTSGWSGDRTGDTRDRGTGALARFVADLADAEQEFPLGEGMSYNNAALAVAGRVIEVVTGRSYEAALTELVLAPLGMKRSLFFAEDVMTHRFVVGHVPVPEEAQSEGPGPMMVARPWNMPRGSVPAGGITADVHDLMRWIRFHLGQGTAADGTRVLSPELLARMQQPTYSTKGTALGDHVGISWMLSDLGGERVVEHGGSTIGQESAFTMVPERGFGITSTTNASAPGNAFNKAVVAAVRKELLGLEEVDPVPSDRSSEQLAQYIGAFETVALTIDVTRDGGGLSAVMEPKQSFLDGLGATKEEFTQPPLALGLVEGDSFVVTDGSSAGMIGTFVRSGHGSGNDISGVHLGGRLARRVPSSG